MTLLFGIAGDLVHFLIIVDMGAAIILWTMGFRERFLMVSHTPEWRGWLTLSLRIALPRKYPKAYYAHLRRSMLYGVAFLITISIGALLILLDNLFFKAPGC